MPISFPLSLPTSIGIANIELRANNVVAVSQSPFTFATQTHQYPGQMWSATVSLPPQRREFIEPWIAFLLSLNGPVGSFLLGDPNCVNPRGTATTAALAVDAAIGATTVSLTLNGTLLAGDYVQFGSGTNRSLHKVLKNVTTGTVDVDLWPALRVARTAGVSSVSVVNAQGLFRLSSPQQSWSINESSAYGLSFEAMEFIT